MNTMKYYVYILRSITTEKYYVGQTYNVEKRAREHNEGLVRSTKSGKPWKLIWTRETDSRSEAMKIERTIKKRGVKRYLEVNKI